MSFALLTGALKSIGKISVSKWKGFKGGMQAAGETAKTDIVSSFQGMISALNPLSAITQTVSEVFTIFGDILGSAMIPLTEKLFEVLLSDRVIGLIVQVTEVITSLIEIFFPLFDILIVIIDIVIELVSAALEPLMTIFEALFPVILIIVEAILPLFDIFKEFIPIIEFLADVFVAILLPVLEFLIPIIEFLAGVLKFLFNLIANSIVPIFETVVTVFKFMANVFVNVLNFIIGIINGVLAVLTLGAVQIPNIPALADGAAVFGPTLALIGESGPEVVVPLDKFNQGRGDNTEMERLQRKQNDKMDRLIEIMEGQGVVF